VAIANSILMTVFNRPPRVLRNTLHALAQNDLTNCEVIIVDDGSTVDYGDLVKRYRWLRIEPDEYPDWTYTIPHPDGGVINNPALAWNRAIAEAQGKRLMFLSSDCMVPEFGVAEAKNCKEFYWLATVMDQATNLMYVCEKKPIPLHFFSSCKKSHVEAIGGFDEEYLKGIAFEDNDFGARLGLHCGQALISIDTLVMHQSHPQTAYSDGHLGLHTSEAYTVKKWGGVPWRDMDMRDPVSLETCRDGKLLRVTPSLGADRRPAA